MQPRLSFQFKKHSSAWSITSVSIDKNDIISGVYSFVEMPPDKSVQGHFLRLGVRPIDLISEIRNMEWGENVAIYEFQKGLYI